MGYMDCMLEEWDTWNAHYIVLVQRLKKGLNILGKWIQTKCFFDLPKSNLLVHTNTPEYLHVHTGNLALHTGDLAQ